MIAGTVYKLLTILIREAKYIVVKGLNLLQTSLLLLVLLV